MEEHTATVAEAEGPLPSDLGRTLGGTVEPDAAPEVETAADEPTPPDVDGGDPAGSTPTRPDDGEATTDDPGRPGTSGPERAGSVGSGPAVETAGEPGADAIEDEVDAGGPVGVTTEPEPTAEASGEEAVAVAAAAAGDTATAADSPVGTEESGAADDDEVVPYDLPRILAIANQKGGVGKTTTSVNLGASLAEMGYRVLVVDLDPQGNASTGLGVNARELEGSVYDVIMSDAAVEDCVEPTSLKNLFVVPATIDLAGAEIELVPAFSRELKLRRALHEVRDDYDYVVIDCPPSLGLLTVNGLAAADDVVVPIQCEYYTLEGLSQLIRNVTLVQKNLNPSLEVRGIVLTMYDARTKLADQVEQEVRKHFGRTVYQTVIPRTVRLSEAPSFGQPIILFDPTSRGAVAYRELAKEVSSGATRRTG